jgi:subtilisin family serine protease
MSACDFSPSSAEDALTVGSTNQNDQVASWSNYGSCVDILAPGSHIRSINIPGAPQPPLDSGTSFSAPLVSGVGALVLATHRGLNPSQLKTMILSTATRNVVREPLHGMPNLLLYNGVEQTIVLSGAMSQRSEQSPLTQLNLLALVVAVTVWTFIA